MTTEILTFCLPTENCLRLVKVEIIITQRFPIAPAREDTHNKYLSEKT